METVQQLRAAIAGVNPALLTTEDRLALLDLFERADAASIHCSSA